MNSLVAGVDGIEHGAKLNDEALDIMKERGVYYVPTASGIGAVAEKERKNGNTNLADIICEEVVFPQLESIKKAHKKGILIGAGTDTLGDLCDESPLEDLHNIRKVNTVIFEGEIVNEKWMCNLQ
jgi:imidazolonepropionase-like amidohydrolase